LSSTGLAILYIIIWWVVFFAILPMDVNRNRKFLVPANDSGAPENPKIVKKFIYCTAITSFIFMIIYILIKYEYLNLRNLIA
jgi:predicted secreted protein